MLVTRLSDPNEPIYADSQGSASLLPNGAFLVDYGEIPVMKEFGTSDPDGSDVRWTARFGFDNLVQSYRGYKSEWEGFPSTRPDLAVEDDDNGCFSGYVSWNGATNVEAWIIHEGQVEDGLSYVGRIGYKGFETRFTVSQPCVQVVAVVCGQASTRSAVVCSASNKTSDG